MQEVRSYLDRLANSESNVLLTGETGTGKELAAEHIHRNSSRAQKPFVCINCAAIPDTLMESELFGYEKGAFTGASASKMGKLRQANGGTVFLDEIGDMTPYTQAKLLRAIESKEIQPLGGRGSIPLDFRIIAATNHDLEKLAGEGKFRQDLYFRLNVGSLHLPPLRERREDIPALLAYHVAELNRRLDCAVEGFVDEVIDYLLEYEWPGNVRELRNVLEASFLNVRGGRISLMDLPEQFRKRLKRPGCFPQGEREHLLSALLSTDWNKSKAAEKLHWSRMTVYRKLTKYQLRRGSEREESGGGERAVTPSDAA
jgi:two-component system response regulator HydG/two-component system response regulator AtoC